MLRLKSGMTILHEEEILVTRILYKEVIFDVVWVMRLPFFVYRTVTPTFYRLKCYPDAGDDLV